MNPNGASISVIVPVYNGEPFLEQALQSAFAQTRRPDKIILVDDGSTDGTAAIARSHPDVTYIRQPNRGVSSACNLGIRSAAEGLIAFLDADDFWAADMLEKHCALLEQNPEIQVVLGLVQPFRMKPAGAAKPEMEYLGSPARLLNMGSCLFRKRVFDRIGLMDEALIMAADWDWFLRAREEGVPMLTRPETALFYRRHGANITNRTKPLDRQLLLMFKKTLERRRRREIAGALPRLSDFMAEIKRNGFLSNDLSAKPRGGPPTVSVIMPVKNCARFLAEAMSSLREQTYRDFEILVIDGRSSDNTAAVVRDSAVRDDQPLRFIIQAGNGLADARNTGIEAARGRLIAFLDGDDRWIPAKLELQVNRLSADPSLQYCLGWVRFFMEPGTRMRPGFSPKMFERGQIGLTPGALLARRELFQTLGGFDPALAIGCDSDWFARASDRKIQMAVVPEALLLKRIHGENLSARADVYRRDMLTVLRQSVLRKRRSGGNDFESYQSFLKRGGRS